MHAVILAHGLEIAKPTTMIHAIDSMINHILIDDAEEYLRFLQDLFPYYEKYGAMEQLYKLMERIEYVMNEYYLASPCDRALLLDYKAELLLQKSQAEKALKKRKRAIEIMEKEYAQTIDRRTVSLLSNLRLMS